MDRILEKTLEKIKKLKARQQFQKIRPLLEELPLAARGQLDVAHEVVGVSLRLDPWQEVLKVLRHALMAHDFVDLLGGDNREAFIKKLEEYPALATALFDLVSHLKYLDAVDGWFSLCEPADQRYLIQAWLKEGERNPDQTKATLYKVCAAVGMLKTGDEKGAFHTWALALEADPRQLKKVMGYCQSLNPNKASDLTQRLKLIKLVAASGRKTETLTLLKALGSESRDNALKVLNELPELLPKHLKSKDVLAVRFNLALKLGDREIIQLVIRDMNELTEDDLFPFKKQALHQLKDKDMRLSVLLSFVRLYIQQENWENAAPLLQMLYEESPAGDVVELMEQVLDRFPIITSLRYLLGKHRIERGDVVAGMQHLGAIAQIPEYELNITRLLENYLTTQYDTDVARLLVHMQAIHTNRAGLVALLMSIKDPRGFMSALSEWGDPHMREQTNPFWALALIRGNQALNRFEQSYPFMCQFLKRFPDLAPEAVRYAEKLFSSWSRDYTELIRIIETNAEHLEPKRAWAALRGHFVNATLAARAEKGRKSGAHEAANQPSASTSAPPPVSTRPTPKTSEEVKAPPQQDGHRPKTTGVPPEFHHFRGHLEAGNFRAAAEVAEKTVATYPQSILFVLNQLERLSRDHPREVLWPLTMLRILIASAAFEKATEVGRRALSNHHFQSDMPHIYQLLARAYEGMDDQTEALRFYCLSSRQGRFYDQNRDRLLEMLFPKHPQFINEVVQLVLNNEDQEIWEELMKGWHKARPEDLSLIIKAQEAFTNQLDSPQAILDLTFWYLQAGRLKDIDETLNRIDLQDPQILDYLTHIAHLAHLKYPDDPKPKFFLGKYYLVQRDVTKAVDTFRNLARQIPEAAETIYHFLRTWLKKNADETELPSLYGLLIRFALDYGSPVAAVRLLEELGRLDRNGATELVRGVFRVILRKEERLEAMYELMGLLYNWGDKEIFLDVAEQGGFGDHMATERLEWLHSVSRDPILRDRAMLAIANAYHETFDFSRCREALRRIEHGYYKRKALPLYERLAERFPDNLEVWREAAWASFPQNPTKGICFFTKLLECDHFEYALEGYAFLHEQGQNPDFENLLNMVEDPNQVYVALKELYHKMRLMELAYGESEEQPISPRALEWLIDTHQFSRLRENMQDHEELGQVEQALMEAHAMLSQGQLAQAAWHLAQQPVPVEIKQSLFASANLIEQAVLIKNPGSRLPIFLRDIFLESFRKPAMISASYTHLKNLIEDLNNYEPEPVHTTSEETS